MKESLGLGQDQKNLNPWADCLQLSWGCHSIPNEEKPKQGVVVLVNTKNTYVTPIKHSGITNPDR